jgi:acyl carrier protein
MIETFEKLKNYIVDNFLFGDDKGLEYATSFLENGIIDSTGILELISFLEESFGMKVKDDELIPENLDSINNLVKFIALKTRTA